MCKQVNSSYELICRQLQTEQAVTVSRSRFREQPASARWRGEAQAALADLVTNLPSKKQGRKTLDIELTLWVKIWVNIAVLRQSVSVCFVSLSLSLSLSHAYGKFWPFREIKMRESYFCKGCVTFSSFLRS